MRRRQTLQKVVKELDAFPKVPEDYQKPTVRGGTLSLLSISIILLLVISEFFYYRSTETSYRYSVDTDMESELRLSVDMTVATPCRFLGADLIDLSGDSVTSVSNVQQEDVVFELTPAQKRWLDRRRAAHDSVSELRSLGELTFLTSLMSSAMPGVDRDERPKDACRIYGSLSVRKVAGNFHVTTGRSVPHPQGHAHMNVYIPPNELNFSHRIDSLAFGPVVPGAVNPLDATLQTTAHRHHIFQYYLQIVPTKLRTMDVGLDTCQYSVSERSRPIDHHQGSHGIPGIFIKYEMSPMMVEIVEKRKPLLQFFIRLIGIVGGIFATSGWLHVMIGIVSEFFSRRSSQEPLPAATPAVGIATPST